MSGIEEIIRNLRMKEKRQAEALESTRKQIAELENVGKK